jgi:predicted secreted protein
MSLTRYTFGMLLRLVLPAAILLVLVPAAAGTTPRVITDRDSGKTFRVARGHELTLRLSNRHVWSGPRVRGSAVLLTPVNYFMDPGFQEWTIHARARGTVRISAAGSGGTSRLFRIRVIVP